MALARLMRYSVAMMLLLLVLINSTGANEAAVDFRGALHDVAADEVAPEDSSRQLQEMPTMPPRPQTLLECSHPLTGMPDYESVCPPGYFQCCSTCQHTRCFSEKGLSLSWRGVNECIVCAPGDYCTGCDTFKRCQPSDIPGRIGARVSKAGSIRAQDCEICPAGYEADMIRKTCVKRWTDVCNFKYVKRCVRGCRSPDFTRRKSMNFCEKMQCQMFCANLWSPACAAAFKVECQYRKDGPYPYDIFSYEEEWLNKCDVDCNGALSAHLLHIVVLLCCAAMAMSLHIDWRS